MCMQVPTCLLILDPEPEYSPKLWNTQRSSPNHPCAKLEQWDGRVTGRKLTSDSLYDIKRFPNSMERDMSDATQARGTTERLDTTARVAAVAGGAGSLALLLRAGQTAPLVVIVLMAIWVLSPFIVLFAARAVATRWTASTRTTLAGITILLAIASVAVYANDGLRPPGRPPAFLFVLVPPASLALIAASVAVASIVARRRARTDAAPRE